jgi:hypothetical protein
MAIAAPPCWRGTEPGLQVWWHAYGWRGESLTAPVSNLLKSHRSGSWFRSLQPAIVGALGTSERGLTMIELPDYLKQGDLARLIPVGSGNQKERAACSVFLSCLGIVQPYARKVLGEIGRRVGNAASIHTYTDGFRYTARGAQLPSRWIARP